MTISNLQGDYKVYEQLHKFTAKEEITVQKLKA
jgi:hypothetical protein